MDIRDWALGHEKMGKGITLSEGEAEKLEKLLGAIEDLDDVTNVYTNAE